MGFDADWSHAGPATAVRDAKGLVQIEMAHVCTIVPGPGEADLRIKIGAVEINLSTLCMYDVADRSYRAFKYAVRGRIGYHDRSQPIGEFLRLGAELDQVHIALGIATNRYNTHARHVR